MSGQQHKWSIWNDLNVHATLCRWIKLKYCCYMKLIPCLAFSFFCLNYVVLYLCISSDEPRKSVMMNLGRMIHDSSIHDSYINKPTFQPPQLNEECNLSAVNSVYSKQGFFFHDVIQFQNNCTKFVNLSASQKSEVMSTQSETLHRSNRYCVPVGMFVSLSMFLFCFLHM